MAEAAPVSGLRRMLVTATGMLASFTMVLSGTIVNVASPDVMGAFGVGLDKAQFLATAYIATMTASQLLNAWFVGTFGQRSAFVIVLVVFVLGSVICATSPDIDVVILGRVMQGFAAGVVQPLVMVVIFQVFPKEERGLAMGIYSMGLVLALGLGPVVGGITVDLLGWRYIFMVPIPLVTLAFALGVVFIPAGRREGARRAFDWVGYGLLCVGLFCLMSAIANGQREGWASDRIVAQFAIGAAASIGFVRSQLRASAALLDLTLFVNPRFAAAALVTFVFGIGNFAMNYLVPVYGQLVQGYTPTVAGFLLLPAALAALTVFPIIGRLSDRTAPQVPVMGGLVLFALGAALLSTTDVNTTFWTMAWFAVISRFGMGFITPPLVASALRALPPEQLNHGSGTINFCRQLGGAMGINVLVACLELRTQFHGDALTATQSAGNTATRELIARVGQLLGDTGLGPDLRQALALDHLGSMIVAQARTMAFQDGFMIITTVFVLALLPAWMLGRSQRAA
ncbi:MAG: DHA2 family efflux MFS transporter permease subunit [Ectothiorhodospiraceae bacterium]|nr:DHA2 family efflux MFS transporter permease subunit [Chromatiales bacterium]MCP5156740.1 DHA2 family efflux MFS transporter permease subunit [Ectothiorhodospiraceae bacterium]